MTSTVRYPSDQFPGFPPVTLNIPEGWQPISSPAVLVAAGAEPKEGEFRRNVVATAARFPAEFTLESATEVVIGKFSALPELVELGRYEGLVLGHPGVRYEASHLDEHLGALVQIVHITVIDRGDVNDLVQVTATCTGEQAQALLPELRTIVESAASTA